MSKQQKLWSAPAPDLMAYDVIMVNTSAGKDSQAMLDYVVELADKAGVRDRIIAVHCDLGRVEWPGTVELAARQAGHYGLRFEVVRRHGRPRKSDGKIMGDLLDHVEERGMWPGPATRYCTADHKTSQAFRLITKLVRELGKGIRILYCLGLRAEESPGRKKMQDFVKDWKSNSVREVDRWLPIHGWVEDYVWQRIKESKVPYHPAYDLGMPRLSCMFCIFAPRSALILAGKNNPELLDEYVRIEKKIGHTFKKDLSLESIRNAIRRGEEPGGMDGAWNM